MAFLRITSQRAMAVWVSAASNTPECPLCPPPPLPPLPPSTHLSPIPPTPWRVSHTVPTDPRKTGTPELPLEDFSTHNSLTFRSFLEQIILALPVFVRLLKFLSRASCHKQMQTFVQITSVGERSSLGNSIRGLEADSLAQRWSN